MRVFRPDPAIAEQTASILEGKTAHSAHRPAGAAALTLPSPRPILSRALAGRFEDRRGAGPEGSAEMPMHAGDIERLIKARIPDAEVTIRDLAGDGDHYAATVIAESFRGKSRVQQHQLVYEALRGQMGGALHALALQTGVPQR
jgi:stress-induced morphogen